MPETRKFFPLLSSTTPELFEANPQEFHSITLPIRALRCAAVLILTITLSPLGFDIARLHGVRALSIPFGIHPTSGIPQGIITCRLGRMKTISPRQAMQELFDRGYTQTEIAKATAMKQASVSRIISGARVAISHETALRILEAHRLTLADIAKPQ